MCLNTDLGLRMNGTAICENTKSIHHDQSMFLDNRRSHWIVSSVWISLLGDKSISVSVLHKNWYNQIRVGVLIHWQHVNLASFFGVCWGVHTSTVHTWIAGPIMEHFAQEFCLMSSYFIIVIWITWQNKYIVVKITRHKWFEKWWDFCGMDPNWLDFGVDPS